ncbi:MAG: PAS domain-containing protein [Rhizobiaceae bacterium]|nr:PAS domain-containing protein [Rhizobiaceae bacterium]
MRLKTSIEIFTYWEQLRGSFDAPSRNLVQPKAVRHILPELFILEHMPDQAPRFRLAGTAICGFMGRELRGESFARLWAGSQPDDPVRIADGVMAHVVPALINATGYSLSGCHMAFEVVLMPMRSSSGACDRLLGCLTPATHSEWLGGERLEFLALDRSRLLHDRPNRPSEHPSHSEHVDLIDPRESVGLGEMMRRILNLKSAAGQHGWSDPLRHRSGRGV